MMWGHRLTKQQTEKMLQDICQVAAEYVDTLGIEFGQKIHHIGFEIHDQVKRAVWLAGLFQNGVDCQIEGKIKRVRLKLLGFSGRGSLAKRLDFCTLLPNAS
jgi:hypothetical protein